jgi:hypothetical protein
MVGAPARSIERGRQDARVPASSRRVLSTVVAAVAVTLVVLAASPADAASGAPHAVPAVAAVAAPPGGNTTVGAATGSGVVCDKYGSTPVAGGRYVVQNDLWGADDPQCVRAFDTGFEVTVGAHHNTDQPAGYPSIFTGCHYGTCTTGTQLPKAVGTLGPVTSSWAFTTPPNTTYTAAYDIWFDPTARRDGTVTGTEMMIWLHNVGTTPLGAKVGTTTVAGATWDVWRGQNGAQVVSYVRQQPVDGVAGLDLTAFMADASGRGMLPPSWFLTSVQAGFEPFTGGAGLTTTGFSVAGVSAGG